jgi:adenosylhomocysteine nucleosidase
MSSEPTDRNGLIVALPAEARSLGVRGVRPGECARWQHGWLAVSGIGPHNAMRAAERLLECGIDRLANWGVAGALDGELAPGDIVVPDRIRHAPDDPGFATDAIARERIVSACSGSLTVRQGALWSAPEPLASQADKRAVAAQSGAIAVDMEAASIAAVATRAGLPFVVVKAICDPLDRELPRRIMRALDGGSAGPSLRMLSAIAFGGPPVWSAARSLSQDFSRARRALTSAARLAARACVAA